MEEEPADFRIPRISVQSMTDEDLFWAVIEPIWPDREIELDEELVRIAQGTPGQRAIYATTLFAREVDNGGLLQFLGNSSDMYTKHVEEGLRLLGANELLDAFLDGIGIFSREGIPIKGKWSATLVKIICNAQRPGVDLPKITMFQASELN